MEPHGFYLQTYPREMPGCYAFLRPAEGGLLEGVGLYTSQRFRAFTVEIGVIRQGVNFFSANSTEGGRWRELGLRTRLGSLTYDKDQHLSPDDRSFFRFEDSETLEAALQNKLELALQHGPPVWERFRQRMLTST